MACSGDVGDAGEYDRAVFSVGESCNVLLLAGRVGYRRVMVGRRVWMHCRGWSCMASQARIPSLTATHDHQL
jgi:hypothetical protein